MGMFAINTNVSAQFAQRQLNDAQSMQAQERLSSGLKINSAADDASGLSITQQMEGQIRGLGKAAQNAQDGISLIQTAEGGLSESQGAVQRMRELAVRSANDTFEAESRQAVQDEVNSLATEVQRIADQTQFNELNLLNGDFSDFERQLQVGANEGENINFGINDMGTEDGALNIAGDGETVRQSMDNVRGFANQNVLSAFKLKDGVFTADDLE